ncbi:9036_t:CDS:2, partial [Gigaspora rosea]
ARDYSSNRARRKPSIVLLTGTKVVQAKMGTTRRLDIPSIEIYNINGVKNNSYWLQELVDFGIRKKFNLLDIVETNIEYEVYIVSPTIISLQSLT